MAPTGHLGSTAGDAPPFGFRRAPSVFALLRPLWLATALLPGLALSGAIAQAPVVQMRGLAPGELRSDGFALDRRQELRITAVGAGPASDDNWFTRTFGSYNISFDRKEPLPWQGNAWILDARTRAVVWELRAADTDRGRRDGRTFDGTVRLPAGNYEVWYASYPAGWQSRTLDSNGEEVRSERTRSEALSSSFELAIRADERARHLSRAELARLREEFTRTAIISFTDVEHSTSRRMGFVLDRPTELEIYVIGEARKDGAFDSGWIIDADTRERIWGLEYASSDYAGGAEKNRSERRTLKLPAGRYAAMYATDDSHDPSEWNSAPPYDPSFYGMTIRVLDDNERARVKTLAYDPWPTGTAVVALTRMRDHESRSAGFTLSRAARVRIYAIGEGSGDRMVDRGWITDASTRRRVWTMELGQTSHAGGDAKNRIVDRTLKLDAGSYLVSYATDDSHAYNAWNAAPPLDAEHWGISIYPATDADRGAFALYEEHRDLDVIAEILRVGDDAHDRARFTLDRDGDVRVYAIGEGSDDQMYDYAWIQDANSREIVWEMRYRATEHAGGASKNRQVNETVRLPAGDYILHYRSDGSHSFGDWNADPPDDPNHWGATVYRVPQHGRP